MKRIVVVLLTLLPFLAQAQDSTKVRLYGFVRNYFNYDSRQTVTVCGGEYLMIPADEDWNMTPEEEAAHIANGIGAFTEDGHLRYDRNAPSQAHLLALSSRFGLAFSGPDILGAQSNGKIEGDFAGFGNNNTILRLRLAYIKLTWRKTYEHCLADVSAVRSELLMGQDWHPLSGEIMPEVLGMAAGAPFRPHSRTPQLSWKFYPSECFGFTATALYQYQFTSAGPEGESAKYANQSIVPELFVGLNYRNGKIYSQLGVDYTHLTIRTDQPAAYTDPVTGNPVSFTISTIGRCDAFSPTFYFQYTRNLLAIKFRSTLAQNLAHLNMLSGYAEVGFAPGRIEYQPLTASVSYLNIAYGQRWRANLFVGYQKNLGLLGDYSILSPAGTYYGLYMKKGINNINSIYRVAPSISFNTKAFNIGLEYEWTAVTYGDLQPDGTVADNANLRQVSNHRICALVKYNF